MIMTKNGNLIAKTYLGSNGAVRKVVVTLVPIISNTDD